MTHVYLLHSSSNHTRLTSVLEVERELEGRPELMLGGGSHLQNNKEFSESRTGYAQKTKYYNNNIVKSNYNIIISFSATHHKRF